MTDRILDLSESPAHLRVRNKQLEVERNGYEAASVPLAELAVLLIAHPQVTCTQAVLAGMMEQRGAVIACDARRQPVGLMLPTAAHFVQAERIAAQAGASAPLKKRLWRQIVRCKIRTQARLLDKLHGDDWGLGTLIRSVRSGDPANVEARAAVRYWPALFGDPTFRRRREADDQNRMLNYGYAVLRALVGRALCAAGLHPSLGIHHHNKYNAFCLADDVMEPYRPLVDEAVFDCVGHFGRDAEMDREVKARLFEAFLERRMFAGESRTLFDIAARTAQSLSQAFMKRGEELEYPELFEGG